MLGIAVVILANLRRVELLGSTPAPMACSGRKKWDQFVILEELLELPATMVSNIDKPELVVMFAPDRDSGLNPATFSEERSWAAALRFTLVASSSI